MPVPVREVVGALAAGALLVTLAPAADAATSPKTTAACTAKKGSLDVTVTAAKGATEKGGTITLERRHKAVTHKHFTFGTPDDFCVAAGSYAVVIKTTAATTTKTKIHVTADKTTTLAVTSK